MDDLIQAIKIYSSPRFEEDFVDRLNFQATTFIFFIATSAIFSQTFFGKPLQCWTPNQFRGGWDEYTNNYCLIENTYFVPYENRSLPQENKARDDAELQYYQWVPFVLGLQTLCFCVPHIVWRMINWISGIQLRAIVSMAVTASESEHGVDQSIIAMIANHLSAGLKMSRQVHRHFVVTSNPIGILAGILTIKARCYVSFCYFIMKGLFIVNAIVQLAIISRFLGIQNADSIFWGMVLVINLFKGNDWSRTGIFPRVTMCDFEVRELGNIHRWSVQCVLPLNMFSEKLYIILWFWLHIVLVVTFVNLTIWMFQILRDQSRMDFIKEMLDNAQALDRPRKDEIEETTIQRMYEDFGWDGILILRIILSNAGQMACVATVYELYKKYLNQPYKANGGTPPTPKLVSAPDQ